jgi:steroid 5-alpha reductase family enzyme
LWLRRVPVVPRTETVEAEKYMSKRAEFDEYRSRTSFFVPETRRSPIP